MSVRQGLLAILAQGPCYGYQLRTEFERRTGATSSVNVGQIYNTLERLERDGLVSKDDVDAHGHVYWRITDAGSADAREWLDTPVERPHGTRDEIAIKIALAATLPGVDVAGVVDGQRAATRARLERLESTAIRDDAEGLARSLVVSSLVFAAEAELRWLDDVEARLARHPEHAIEWQLATERPRRGRPARGVLSV